MYLILLQHVKNRLKLIVAMALVSACIGVWRMLVEVLLMAISVSAVHLSARGLRRINACLVWIFIVGTFVLSVHDGDLLLVWALGFFFGVLANTAVDVFLDTKIHHVYVIVFAHLIFFLSAIYAKVDAVATTRTTNTTSGGAGGGGGGGRGGRRGGSGPADAIWWCFFGATISGSFYSGTVDEYHLQM